MRRCNTRIQSYIQDDLMPRYVTSLEEWLEFSKQELQSSQDYLIEMSETFNELFGKDCVVLQCDFQVIDDWRRDVNRMNKSGHKSIRKTFSYDSNQLNFY